MPPGYSAQPGCLKNQFYLGSCPRNQGHTCPLLGIWKSLCYPVFSCTRRCSSYWWIRLSWSTWGWQVPPQTHSLLGLEAPTQQLTWLLEKRHEGGLSEDWGWDHWVRGAVLEGQALAALMPHWVLLFWGSRICLTCPEEGEVDEVADPLHGSAQGQLCLPTRPLPGPSSESTPSLWCVCAWGNQPLLAAVTQRVSVNHRKHAEPADC